MNREGKDKEFYYAKLCTVLIHVYHTAKVDSSVYFRAKFIKFVSGMRSTVAQDIHRMCEKCDVEKSPIFFLSLQVKVGYHDPDKCFCQGLICHEMVPNDWVVQLCLLSCDPYQLKICFKLLIFYRKIKIKRG